MVPERGMVPEGGMVPGDMALPPVNRQTRVKSITFVCGRQ